MRLRKQKDFDRVFAQGKFCSQGALSLKTVRGPLAVSRFGFIVGKKISKKAVERNRIKRLLRESVRLNEQTGNLAAGFDTVIMPRQNLAHSDLVSVKFLVDNLLKKSGLLK